MGGPTAARRPAASRSLPRRRWREYAHVLGAESVWLDRLLRRPARVSPCGRASSRRQRPRSPNRSARSTSTYLDALTAEALDAPCRTSTARGVAFETPVEDILLQVFLHGQYHRGKINLMLRQSRDEPMPTDYIAFARGVPAATTQVSADDAARPAPPLRRLLIAVRRSALDADGAAEPLLWRPHARHARRRGALVRRERERRSRPARLRHRTARRHPRHRARGRDMAPRIPQPRVGGIADPAARQSVGQGSTRKCGNECERLSSRASAASPLSSRASAASPCHPERAQRVEGSALLDFFTESTEHRGRPRSASLRPEFHAERAERCAETATSALARGGRGARCSDLSAGPSKPFGVVDGEERAPVRVARPGK